MNYLMLDKDDITKSYGKISKKEYRSISRKKPQKKVGKFVNNQLLKKYSSAWDASKDLCISYQTVIDYCYNAVKDPKHDLRWI